MHRSSLVKRIYSFKCNGYSKTSSAKKKRSMLLYILMEFNFLGFKSFNYLKWEEKKTHTSDWCVFFIQ